MIRRLLAPATAGGVDELALAQREELAAHESGQRWSRRSAPRAMAEHDGAEPPTSLAEHGADDDRPGW